MTYSNGRVVELFQSTWTADRTDQCSVFCVLCCMAIMLSTLHAITYTAICAAEQAALPSTLLDTCTFVQSELLAGCAVSGSPTLVWRI